MFSIVIPLYNKEESIAKTIFSVLNQTFQDFEIIVVNDGSTDESVERVKEITDARIRLINQPNGGVSSARNKGIEQAREEWIAFLDGDDVWEVNHLNIISEMINKFPAEKIFATSFVFSDGRLSKKDEEEQITIYNGERYFRETLESYILWTSITVLHRSVFDQESKFIVGLIRGEDREVWDRLVRKFNIVKSNQVTATYRVDAENRACMSYAKLNKTYVSKISLKGTRGEERKYLKNLAIAKLKECIKKKKIKDASRILFKFNFALLTR